MTSISFVVPGQPVPYQRVASRGTQRFTTPKSRAYMGAVRLRSMQAVGQAKHAGTPWPLDARYAVEIHVTNGDRRARDLDNVAKNLDGCKDVLWYDDAQIDDLRIVRCEPNKDAAQLVISVHVMACAQLEIETPAPRLSRQGARTR